MDSKPLVIYYSRTETTAKIVETVLPTINGEARRLGEPSSWMGKLIQSLNKGKDNPIVGPLSNLEGFDPIILLTPIWKGKPTPAMTEFLDGVDLHGKKVVLGLVGANATNPDALQKLHRRAIERGCIFIETIYLRGVPPGRDWSSLGDEDYRREAAKLAEKVFAAQGFNR